MNLLDLMVRIGVDDQATSRIRDISSSVGRGLSSAARAGAAAMGAAVVATGAATAAMTRSALESYASYEQLSGGIEKLYGGSSSKMMEYAETAYVTSGRSANEYMEAATQFSSSLIKSLAGDTSRAADQTDKAMRLMSDNVNVFGSDATDVENAIKGISRENYTMLDNLKLGYAGTKEGMESLIADANEYARSIGEAGDLEMGNFSDMIDAIDLIQQKQGIAGTTAKEAATTIEGSIAMTRAAWTNLLTEFGKDDGDVGKRMQELVDSAKTTLLGSVDEATGEVQGGIVPRIQQIAESMASAMPQAIPIVTDAAREIVPSILNVIGSAAPSIASSMANAASQMAESLKNNKSSIADGAVDMLLGIMDAVGQAAPQILEALVVLLTEMVASIVDRAPELADAAGEMMLGMVSGIANGLVPAMDAINSGVEGMLNAVGSRASAMASAAWRFVSSIPQKIGQAVGQARARAGEMVNAVVSKIREIPGRITGALSNAGSLLVDAGRNIIQGLINGIQERFGALAAKFSEITSKIPKLKGPEDVDVRLLYNNGQLIMDGLIEGIESRYSDLRSTLADATSMVASTPAPTMAVQGAGSYGDVYNIYVQAGTGLDEIALAVADAVESRNMMRGRKAIATNVRYA